MSRSPVSSRFARVTRRSVLALAFRTAAAAEKTAQAPDSLVFCAYNVKNWLLMDRFEGGAVVQKASKPEPEKAAVIGILKTIAPDVLGLSEIGGESDLKEIQSRLKKAGIDLPQWELTHGGDLNRSLGLLSRFPISSRQSITDLTYTINGQVFPVQRGFLDVTVQPRPGFSLRCIGVHLKSMREVPEADQEVMRRNEAGLLRKHLSAILDADPATPILLYGDFNEHRHEPPIKAIQGSRTGLNFMEDLRIVDVNGQTWTHYWEAADSYSRLDYFFLSRALKPLVDKQRSYIFHSDDFDKASDHRPIVVSLNLPVTMTGN